MKNALFKDIPHNASFCVFGHQYTKIDSIKCIGPYGFEARFQDNDTVQIIDNQD